MKPFEKLLNLLGWIGIVFLIPVGLKVFGVPGPLEFLHKSLGNFGTDTVLVLIFYGLILLRFLFGHSEIYAPVFIGMIVSFLLVSMTVDISFMKWYAPLAEKLPYFTNHPLIFVVGVLVAFAGLSFGRLKRLHLIVQLLLLLALPVAIIVAANIYGIGVVPGLQK